MDVFVYMQSTLFYKVCMQKNLFLNQFLQVFQVRLERFSAIF